MTEQWDDAKLAALSVWATKNNCQLSLEGEIGFGRPCVGILSQGSYVYYDYDDPNYPDLFPIGGVENAYHKSECLAVLGSGDKALLELFRWVQHLDANGFEVRVEEQPAEYRDNIVALMLHGTHRGVLRKKNS